MEIFFRPDSARLKRKDDWKESAYAFVPYQTNFGELCGLAEDKVRPGKGFGMHPHKDMEISTLVFSGAQLHKDDTGMSSRIDQNHVQTMSAGTGIRHSEYNASETEWFHSFQVWVYPSKQGTQPRYSQFEFQSKDKENAILKVITPDGQNGTAKIGQQAYFSLSTMSPTGTLRYDMNIVGNGTYVHCVSGKVEIAGKLIEQGDALGIYDTSFFNIKSVDLSELIFIEVPMHRGINV